MSHGITSKDTMFSVRETPWHRLGVVLKKAPTSIDDALKKSGLAWKVVQKPIYLPTSVNDPKAVRGGMKLVEGYKANIRKDTGDVLGIVTDRYAVVDNRDGFAFVDNLIGSAMHFETAGSLWEGRKVFVTARLPEWIEVGGDPIAPYVFFWNQHDGAGALSVTNTPTRVVCQNTATYAFSTAVTTHKITHVGDPTQRVHEAREALGFAIDFYKQFAKWGNRLARQKVSERQLAKVLGELYPNGSDLGGRKVKSNDQAREQIRMLFEAGQTVGNAPGSKWAALNAVSEYVDYYGGRTKGRTPQAQFIRASEDPTGLKRRARDLLVTA